MTDKQQAIICDLTVFDAATRRQMAAKVPDLFRAAQRVQELPEGYAFTFPASSGTFMAIATFVEHERQCCPFFDFTMVVPAGGGPLQLRMTGGEGVKAFMQATWQDLQEAVTRGLVQSGPEDDLDEAIRRAAPVLAGTIAKSDA